jgi:hypothetical protein
MNRSTPRSCLAMCMVVFAIASLPGCAKRTDEAMRRAWEKSAGRGTEPGGPGDAAAPGEDDDAKSGRVAFGWARVDEVLVTAVELLHTGPDDSMLARLAERWCAVEPVPQTTDHGPVFVCHPSPPVTVEGHSLVLELGAPGIIGLVARDLTEAQSLALTERARKATGHRCTGPWAQAPGVTARDGTLREEFHTCATLYGPVLAVGRARVRDDDDDRRERGRNRMERGRNVWQVSVAVLGTT